MSKVVCGKYSCVHNTDGKCSMKMIGIDASGYCINYKKYSHTDKSIVEYEDTMQEMCRRALDKGRE